MDTTLAMTWTALCLLLAQAFRKRRLFEFLHIAAGWLLAARNPG